MRTEHLGAEVERLDPESRALLELSVIRGLGDEELAEMLGMEAGRLRARRESVMRELGADSAEEREQLAVSLREVVPKAQPEGVPGPKPAVEPEPSREPATSGPAGPRPRRWALLALGGGVSIALVVALVLALGVEDPPVFPRAPDPAVPEAPRAARFEAVGDVKGQGTARITGPEDGRVLRLTVRGLARPDEGGYVIWLYDSVSNTRPVTGSRRGTFTLSEPLPPGFGRYKFLDISREPADGNLNHSGLSVLRLPLEQLSRP